ncbi:alpha-galactosidase [Nocardia sp. NRRL S-836]|uniref:alpha-galactosidase n=1 Tax=Nocardia sp. NRRL S-836 TaxID=1519492 RepID=UPI000AB886D7|nr:alpha-galactosidase [Nocardia sp. NRRL S-836]
MTTIRWGHDALTWELHVTEGRVHHAGSSLPLVEATAANHGRTWSSNLLVDTAIGSRLRYRGHRTLSEQDWHLLVVELHDEQSGLAAELTYRSPDGVPVVRSEVLVRNEGSAPLRLESVTSLVTGGLGDPTTSDVLRAENDWLAECRWRREPLRVRVPDRNGRHPDFRHKGAHIVAGQGVWSSCGHLPMGGLTDHATGRAWVWQVEHNGGGWRWECGEQDGAGYVALSGPQDHDHGWHRVLVPGAEFRTVPVALACGTDGPDDAFAALTRYRRASRRPHPDHEHLPVVFNDYMNCLMGDPTTAKLLPLVDAAAEAGAEYFVIDAGWYAEEAESWWDSVGAWEASRTRFPGGLREVLDRIRDRGMVPGLWLEPEVIGVRSPLARTLPDEAFFRRAGVRVSDSGRHHLDLRHPAARAHLDAVVDRLVGQWGVGYLKLDHNINPGSGTSAEPAESPADGLLGHNRAHLDWLDGVLDRHPHLVLENCASGGMRMDHALLSRTQLQSTSDQQNLDRYAPIAAAAPAAVTPEQGAVWAYPQPEDTLDEVAFTMASALLGRIHLSGKIADLAPDARALVHEALAVYREIRADLPVAVPSWPLGLPGWDDPWLALALSTPSTTYLTVWRRPGGPDAVTLPLPRLSDVDVERLYPAGGAVEARWEPDTAELVVTLPSAPSAVLYRLSNRGSDG